MCDEKLSIVYKCNMHLGSNPGIRGLLRLVRVIQPFKDSGIKLGCTKFFIYLSGELAPWYYLFASIHGLVASR